VYDPKIWLSKNEKKNRLQSFTENTGINNGMVNGFDDAPLLKINDTMVIFLRSSPYTYSIRSHLKLYSFG